MEDQDRRILWKLMDQLPCHLQYRQRRDDVSNMVEDKNKHITYFPIFTCVLCKYITHHHTEGVFKE